MALGIAVRVDDRVVIVELESNAWIWTDTEWLGLEELQPHLAPGRAVAVEFEIDGDARQVEQSMDEGGLHLEVVSRELHGESSVTVSKGKVRFTVVGESDSVEPVDREEVFALKPDGMGMRAASDKFPATFAFILIRGQDRIRTLLAPTSSDVDSDLGEVLQRLVSEVGAEALQDDQDKRTAAYRRSFDSPEIFVNPYNFVPLPTFVDRRPPTDQRKMSRDRHRGRIELTWRAETPLLFGRGVGTDRRGLEADPEDVTRLRVAGSSLKGALSSLHEAMSGSCLRVSDYEFVPVYREPKDTPRDRRLGIVTAVDDLGRPSAVHVCAESRWIEVGELHKVRDGESLRTGDVFVISKYATDSRSSPTEVKGNRVDFLTGLDIQHLGTIDVSKRDADGIFGNFDPTAEPVASAYVALVSDGKARKPNSPFRVALGSLVGELVAVDPSAHALWDDEVAGADDLRTARRDGVDPGSRRLVEVRFGDTPPRLVGQRLAVPRQLGIGDVVWIEMRSSVVTRFSISLLWRRKGRGDVRSRTPEAAQKCRSTGLGLELCLSCRLFGFVDEEVGGTREAASQHSIKGLVRYSHLTVELGDGSLERRDLPPRGTPRPGSGQFYLDSGNRRDAVVADSELPAAAWGSPYDGGANRKIRGRKFYWHADPVEVPGGQDGMSWSRARVRTHQAQRGGMNGETVELVPAGATVTATVTFENLDDVELGSLLAALDPDRAIGDRRPEFTYRDMSSEGGPRPLRFHLGGGKPLGFGSVTLVNLELAIDDERYSRVNEADFGSETSPRSAEPGELVATYMAWLLAADGSGSHEWAHEVETRLGALAAMLDPDRVNPARVAYPPGQAWGEADRKQFDESFKFFQDSRGGGAGQKSKSLQQLPLPTEDPWLPIHHPEGEKRKQ